MLRSMFHSSFQFQQQQVQLMLGKKLLILFIVSLFLISLFFILRILISEQNYISSTYPRLVMLAVIHIVSMLYFAVWLRMDEFSQYLNWIFLYSSNIVALITITELFVFRNKKIHLLEVYAPFSNILELTYLNIYFILYFFSLIASFILAVIVIIGSFSRWCEEKHRLSNIENNIESISKSSEMRGENCPICLLELNKDQSCCRIKVCSHRFHRQCLKQWTKVKSECPICRRSIIESRQVEVGDQWEIA